MPEQNSVVRIIAVRIINVRVLLYSGFRGAGRIVARGDRDASCVADISSGDSGWTGEFTARLRH